MSYPIFPLQKDLGVLCKAAKFALAKSISLQSRKNCQSATGSEQGVTLLECLVAISVIAILGAMIGPPLVFTAATRLQNQRAEQAFQIAQAEVDRIRTLVARGEHEANRLPAVVPDLRVGAPIVVSNQMKSNVTCPNPYTGQGVASNQLVQIDTTGDCRADFLMQVFRTEGLRLPGGTDTRPIDFSIGVRVYSAKARESLGRLSARQANLSFAAGQGDMNRASRQVGPLAVFDSDLVWSDRSEALCYYRDNPRC